MLSVKKQQKQRGDQKGAPQPTNVLKMIRRLLSAYGGAVSNRAVDSCDTVWILGIGVFFFAEHKVVLAWSDVVGAVVSGMLTLRTIPLCCIWRCVCVKTEKTGKPYSTVC